MLLSGQLKVVKEICLQKNYICENNALFIQSMSSKQKNIIIKKLS